MFAHEHYSSVLYLQQIYMFVNNNKWPQAIHYDRDINMVINLHILAQMELNVCIQTL